MQQSTSHSGTSRFRPWLTLGLGLIVVVLLAAACVPAPAVAPAGPAAPAATGAAPVAPTVSAPAPTVAAGGTVTETASSPAVVGLKSSSLPSGVDADGNFYLGDPKAPIKPLDYSDFQCPYCSRHALQTAPQIDEAHIATGKVMLVFRHFPLD